MHECNNNFAFRSHSSIYTAIFDIHCFFFLLVYVRSRSDVCSILDLKFSRIHLAKLIFKFRLVNRQYIIDISVSKIEKVPRDGQNE